MPEVGERFVGTVVKTTTFGAFVSLSPGRDGLLHVSQIRRIVGGRRVENVEDILNVGDKVEVEIGEIDPRGKVSLDAVVEESAAGEAAEQAAASERPARREREGRERGSRRGSRQRRRTREDAAN